MKFQYLAVACAVVCMAGCGGPDASLLVSAGDAEGDRDTSLGSELEASNRAMVWFPMAKGNTWTFQSNRGATRTIRISSFDQGVAAVSGLFETPSSLGLNSATSNTLFLWDAAARSWKAWLRFGFEKSAWNVGTEPCTGAKLSRSATGTPVMSAAGTFTETRTIQVEQIPSPLALCQPPAFTELTFAADVGLVAFRTGFGERFVLSSALVGGKSYPAKSEVKSALSLDQTTYVNKPNTIRCVTTPCPTNEVTAVAKVEFSVQNTSSASLTWNFNTGCQFDVELVFANGALVKRWSDGRFCTQALTKLTLAPGATKTYTAEMSLTDTEGFQLDGTFAMRAVLLSAQPTAVAAEKSFSVRIEE
jgi:hypothetical protein